MDIVVSFKNFLFAQKDQPSKVTVKNYVSDVKKFLQWYERTYTQPFSPETITQDLIAAFQNEIDNVRSAKRYISSLRKFCHFLAHSGAIKASPFEALSLTKPIEDPWQLKGFTNFLVTEKSSRLTVKNYIIDIKQFLSWLEQVTNTNNIEKDTSVFISINNSAINEYKQRLLTGDRFSPISINRKLSSLRRYLRWLSDKGLLEKKPQVDDIATKEEAAPIEAPKVIPVQELPLTALQELKHEEKKKAPKGYSRFAPIRLAQKTKKAITLGVDSFIINPVTKASEAINYTLWKRSGKKVFAPVRTILEASSHAPLPVPPAPETVAAPVAAKKITDAASKASLIMRNILQAPTATKPYAVRNISKAFYAPLQISLKQLSWQQRLLHHARHTRPAWYARYHEFPIVHHIHFAILILATTVAVVGTFFVANEGPQANKQAVAALPSAPPRTVAFQGRLLDKTNTPITAETNLRFALYNSPLATGSAMLWQESQKITPTRDGYFSVNLGKVARLSQEVFNNNPSLYVGLTVGVDEELQPRQQLPTTNLASNALTLQGLKAITKTDKTANVLLALDSSGDLTIGGSASPTFQATGGQFSFSGQSLLLTTNPGSNGNIQLSPDGSGIIDLQKPVQNTSNSITSAGVPGAVAVDDLLAVSAVSSSHSALTVKQNSSGDIISGYSNGTAKFRVESTGTVTIAGTLTVNGNTITTNNTSFGIANTTVTDLSIGLSAKAVSLGAFSGTTTINNDLRVRQTTNLDGPVNAAGLITANGGLTIPTGKSLTVADFAAGTIPFINTLGQFAQDVNLSWSQPTQALNVTGSLCLRSSTGACPGTVPGTIYASNATVQAADLAENYVSSEVLEPGDVVIPEGSGNGLAVVKATDAYQQAVIGIISTKPGFTLNSDAQPDAAHPYLYPLALQGRVPVKVSTVNGPIKAGDPLTSSAMPGVAMKATKPGQIIAKALENYTATDPTAVNKIMAFVNISYHAPQSFITDSGDLSLALKNPVASTSSIKTDTTIAMGPLLSKTSNFMLDVEAGLIEMKKVSTQTLEVATDNIIVNGVKLNDYIAAIAKKTLEPNPTPTPLAATASKLAVIGTDASASAKVVSPNGTAVAAQTSASNLPLYNSISSDSAVRDITPTPTEAPKLEDRLPALNTDINTIASSPAELGLEKLDINDATISKTLSVIGRTTVTDLGVTGKVTIGLLSMDGLNDKDLTTGQSFASINTSSGPLKFQSDGFNGVDFLHGKITIDTKGNLKAEGNAYFAKDVTVKGTLAANILAPVPGSDLIVDLGNDTKDSLKVQDSKGNHVLTVNQKGDVASSGSGKFANLNIVRGAQADTSVVETIAAGSAGKGVIKAKQKERTILTPFVTKQSLIYVTATSDTQKMTLYVARQTSEDTTHGEKGSFTIQLPNLAAKDITFNWWIVN